MYKFLLLSIILAFTMSSCKELVFGLEYNNDPVDNFESFWNEYDQMYGLFKVRNVDWDAVYDEYRPQVSNQSSERDLYDVFVGMMTILDDSHVVLLPTNSSLPQFESGISGRLKAQEDFHLDIVKDHYLTEVKEAWPFTYGFLNSEIGYLYIEGEPGDKLVDKLMPDIIDYFKDAKGLVVDVRGNTGGEDRGGQAMASYFTQETRPFMSVSIKDGPGRDDFTAPETWFITPKPKTYDGPLVLLTNRHTLSAGETLTLAMNTLPQLSSVGDTTSGGFANAITRELPNGWGYTISIGDWRAADGTSYEGVGIPPDVVVKNQKQDLLDGKDEVLEKAISSLH